MIGRRVCALGLVLFFVSDLVSGGHRPAHEPLRALWLAGAAVAVVGLFWWVAEELRRR